MSRCYLDRALKGPVCTRREKYISGIIATEGKLALTCDAGGYRRFRLVLPFSLGTFRRFLGVAFADLPEVRCQKLSS